MIQAIDLKITNVWFRVYKTIVLSAQTYRLHHLNQCLKKFLDWILFFHDFTSLPDIDATTGTGCLDS
jgi:hypothetical protein